MARNFAQRRIGECRIIERDGPIIRARNRVPITGQESLADPTNSAPRRHVRHVVPLRRRNARSASRASAAPRAAATRAQAATFLFWRRPAPSNRENERPVGVAITRALDKEKLGIHPRECKYRRTHKRNMLSRLRLSAGAPHHQGRSKPEFASLSPVRLQNSAGPSRRNQMSEVGARVDRSAQ